MGSPGGGLVPSGIGRKRVIQFAIAAIAVAAFFVLPSIAAAQTTETWTGQTSTDWNTASNWSPSGVPAADDPVVIPSTSNTPVMNGCPTTTACSAASITLSGSGAKLEVKSGTLNVGGTISAPSGTLLTVDGGTLTFGTLTVGAADSLSLSSGTIDGTLASSAPGTITITNGGVDYGASSSGGLALSGSNFTLDQTSTVTLLGTLAVGSDTYELSDANLDLPASVASTPLVTVGSSGTLENSASSGLDAVEPTVQSAGTISDSSSSGNGLALLNSNTANSAPKNSLSGTITESGSGAINLGSTGTAGDGTTLTGDLDVSNGSGTVAIATTGSGSGVATDQSFYLNGETVTITGTLTYDGANQDAGTIDGTGDFAGGILDIDEGDFGGDTGVTTDVTIDSGATAAIVANDSAWNNSFTFNVAGTLLLAYTSITNAGTTIPTINVSGTLEHTGASGGDVEPTLSTSGGTGGPGTILDDSTNGIVLGNPNAGVTDTLEGTLRTENSGTISLGLDGQTTTFNVGCNFTCTLTTDNYNTAASASPFGAIQTAGATTAFNLDGNGLTIDGTFTDADGTVSGPGQITGPGSVTVAGNPISALPGQLDLTGGDLTGPITIDAPVSQTASATVNGPSAITVDGPNTWTTANDIGSSASGSVVFASGSTLAVGGAGGTVGPNVTIDGTLTDSGTGTWTVDSASVGTNGVVNANDGTLVFSSLTNTGGGTPNNTLTGGSYNVANGATLELPTAPSGGVETLAANLSVAGSGVVEDLLANPGLQNLATIDAGGNLTLTGDHAETTALTDVLGALDVLDTASLSSSRGSGTTEIHSTGTAQIDGSFTGNVTVDQGGSLQGTGTITGDLTNNGSVHPGDSPGELTVTGNYVQGSTGALAVDIDGTTGGQYSVLHVSDNATLAGTLNVTPSSTYASSAATGDQFGLVEYLGSESGSFSTININPPLNNGRTLNLTYGATGVTATVSAEAAPTNSGRPVISGAVYQQGQMLSTTNGDWNNNPTSFTYVWNQCSSTGTGCMPISNTDSSTYTPTSNDVGHELTVTVTATNGGGPSSPETSNPTPVIATAPPTNSGAPVISGTAKQGDVLSTTNGTWNNGPTSFTYQWNRCSSTGTGCAPITNASSGTYTLTSADVGHELTVSVTAHNGAGASTASTSNPYNVVAAATKPAPKVSHASVSGSKLKLTLSEGASIKVTITGTIKGHKSGHKCSASAKKGKSCTIKVNKSKTFTGKSGSNSFSLPTAGLAPGTYKVKVTVKANGMSTSVTVTLKIKKK